MPAHAPAPADSRHAAGLLVLLVLFWAVLAADLWQQTATSDLVGRADTSPGFLVRTGAPPDTATRGTPFTVDVLVTNTGPTAWEPGSHRHFSYRWRTMGGSRVAKESERTAFPTRVEPGATVQLRVRVDPPGRPGLFRFDWGLVNENASRGWQLASGSLTRIVTILPAWYDLPILAVSLLALVVLARTRSGQAFGAWTVGALLTRPLALVAEKDLGISIGAVVVTAGATAICWLFLQLTPRRIRPLVQWSLVTVATGVILADVAHLRYFGDVPTVAAIGPGTAQAGRVLPSAVAVLNSWHLFLVLDLLFTLPAALWALRAKRVENAPAPLRRPTAALACASIVVVVGAAVFAWHLRDDQVFRHLSVVESVGAYGYHLRDVSAVVTRAVSSRSDEQAFESVRQWMTNAAGTLPPPADAFGRAAGRNVIVIQVESLQTFVIGATVNGVEITPTMNRLRHEALWFSQVYDQTGEGRTSDAEHAALTSTLPASRGAVVFAHAANTYVALPGVLRRRGYHTVGGVPFEGSFWNRAQAWEAYGFAQRWFDVDFEPGAPMGWGLNDRDFLLQMATRLADQPEPYFAWLVTLSLHHPFELFPREFRTIDLGRWRDTTLGNYLEAMHYFDSALGAFLARLEALGMLDKTLLVVFGDHDAGLPHTPRISQALGLQTSDASWEAADRVPLFIRGAAGLRGEQPVVGGHVDLAPTILGLLGIDARQFPFFGRDLLANPPDRPVVRPYGGWVDSRHLTLANGECVDRTTLAPVPRPVCQPAIDAARQQRLAGDALLTNNLQRRLLAPLERVRKTPQPLPTLPLAPAGTPNKGKGKVSPPRRS